MEPYPESKGPGARKPVRLASFVAMMSKCFLQSRSRQAKLRKNGGFPRHY